MKKILYIAGALMLLVPAVSHAQALPFVAAETDAASLGTAGAGLVETSSVADASFSNAAVIPFSDNKLDASVGYTMWQPSSSNILNVGVAYNVKSKFGVALGVHYGMNPSYDVTNESGAVAGVFAPKDIHVNAGLAWRFLPFLSLGANIGYATSSLAEGHSYGALAADVFAMAKFGGFRVTAGVANVGTTVKSASGAEFCIPGSIAVGAGYGKVFAEKHGIDVLVDADYYFSGWMAVAAGAAYTFNDLFSVRAGYRYGGESPVPSYASVGAGVKILGIKFDVAYLIASGPVKNTLALSLGYAF